MHIAWSLKHELKQCNVMLILPFLKKKIRPIVEGNKNFLQY